MSTAGETPFVSHEQGLVSIRTFLKGRSSYDVFPVSFRLIVLDTKLMVKKALGVMLQNGTSRAAREEGREGEVVGWVERRWREMKTDLGSIYAFGRVLSNCFYAPEVLMELGMASESLESTDGSSSVILRFPFSFPISLQLYSS